MERIDTLKQGSRSANLHIVNISQPEAAKTLNVSTRSIQTVNSILENIPENVNAPMLSFNKLHIVRIGKVMLD